VLISPPLTRLPPLSGLRQCRVGVALPSSVRACPGQGCETFGPLYCCGHWVMPASTRAHRSGAGPRSGMDVFLRRL